MPELDRNPYHDLVDVDLPRWRRRFHLSLSSWSCPPLAQPARARPAVPNTRGMACIGERPCCRTRFCKQSGLRSCKGSGSVRCSGNRNHSYGRIPTLSAEVGGCVRVCESQSVYAIRGGPAENSECELSSTSQRKS